MRFIPGLCLLLLGLQAQAQPLLNNPKGLMGFRWGMDRQAAALVHPLVLTCHEGPPLISCQGTFPSPAAVSTVLPHGGGGLLLQFSSKGLIGLTHSFLSSNYMDVLTMLHILLGQPNHRIEIPQGLDRLPFLSFMWIRPRTIVEVHLANADNAEIPKVRVTVRAWSRRDYLLHHNNLPAQEGPANKFR